jgi:hypothetical protein
MVMKVLKGIWFVFVLAVSYYVFIALGPWLTLLVQ